MQKSGILDVVVMDRFVGRKRRVEVVSRWLQLCLHCCGRFDGYVGQYGADEQDGGCGIQRLVSLAVNGDTSSGSAAEPRG